MISYKRDVLERQSLSEVKMGRGSPICESVCKKIVEHFKNNVKLQRLWKSHHLQCITSSKVSGKLEKSLCVRDKAEYLCWCLWSSGPQTTLHHSSHDSVIDITKWAQEYFQKPLSVNTIRRAICRCQLSSIMQSGKVFYGQTSPNLTFLLKITDAVSSGLKRSETFQRVISVQFKSQHLWWYGGAYVHTVWAACMFWKALWMLKVYKGFRATYAPLQMTCISAGQCKTTYCSYYNSMAS